MSILSITKTLFKSMFHGPYTSAYPLQKKVFFDKTRGSVKINISDCIFCGICQRRCPTGAITVEKEDRAWRIERLRCIQCSYCTEVCPKKCLAMDGQYSSPSQGSIKDEYKDARVSGDQADH